MFEQLAATAEARLREIEATTERVRHFAEMQKVRFEFARAVAASQHTMAAGLCGLHQALTGEEDGSLRRLILAVVFLQRWRHFPKSPRINFHGSSLAAFAASQGTKSGEEKLAGIEQMFAALTDDLRAAKQNVTDDHIAMKELQDKFRDIDAESVALQMETVQKQMAQYKRRIKDLIAANAEMVPPDRFQEILARATEGDLANDHLSALVKVKDDEIRRQAGVIKEATTDLQKAELRHDADVQEVERMKSEVEEHQTEIEVLTSKLHDRTKDLLALERLNTYKPPGAFSKESGRGSKGEADPMFTSPRINPRFLGARHKPVE
jgi:DNA repair exonuclease SbcCD ATPase subunit